MHQALADNFSYLALVEADVLKYTSDYEKRNGRLKFKKRGKEQALPEAFFTVFLLSTNFFWGGEKQGGEIQYLGYYNPKTSPCRNPFARFD